MTAKSQDKQAPDRQRLIAATEVALVTIAVLAVCVFLALPVIAIVEKTVRDTDFFAVISSDNAVDALRLSLITTTISLLLILLLGTPLAYLLARADFAGKAVLDTLIDLPIVLPPAVGGLGLLMAFGRRGILGGWVDDAGVEIAFTRIAVVMAQTFVASPFYIRAAKAGFESVNRDLERIAYTLGSSRSGAFWRVSVPVALPALMAGAVMAWARALGEFGATIMFAGSIAGRTQTVPLAIYRGLEGGIEVPLALSTLLIVVSFAVLLAFRLLLRRAILSG